MTVNSKQTNKLILCVMFSMMLVNCQNTPSNNSNNPIDSTAGASSRMKTDSQAEAAPLDTITSLADQKDTVAYFRAPDGKVYKVELADENGNLVKPQSYVEKTTDSLYCITDLFLGTERKNAKSTFLIKTIKFYNTVNALKVTLAADSIMRNLNPAITTAINSPRVIQEKRNVNIKTAFIYAISRENDNDFHLIIGDTLPYNAAKSLNVELAGIPNPANTSKDTLTKVRTKVEAYFGEKCSGAYSVFTPPIKISVSGSLFYDIGHPPGLVGTGIYKPSSSWEIHPMSDIVFK